MSFESLVPDPILAVILSKFFTVKEVCTVRAVNRRWKAVVENHEVIFQKFVRRKLFYSHNDHDSKLELSWFQLYLKSEYDRLQDAKNRNNENSLYSSGKKQLFTLLIITLNKRLKKQITSEFEIC